MVPSFDSVKMSAPDVPMEEVCNLFNDFVDDWPNRFDLYVNLPIITICQLFQVIYWVDDFHY